MSKETDIIASKLLGKKVEGSDCYTPSFLVAVPRIENRNQYGIKQESLPFIGHDIWHSYEFSVMTKNGLPVTRVLKLKYDCNSEYIVESKSLKLYLNSFNMSFIGSNTEDCLKKCKDIIKNDLSALLKTEVYINFLNDDISKESIFNNFGNILDYVDENSLVISKFKESPELIKTEVLDDMKSYFLYFDSLRSNCRVTHQPDFGDIFVYYKSCRHIIEDSLVKYICSFRSEYHFHEECCEMIYKRLYDILDEKNGDELFVCALYTRRGGIDISPVRYSHNCNIKDIDNLFDMNKLLRHGIKQ